MKNEELWGQYQTYTSEFTKHSRQLAFAAIAICWLFKTSEFTFPPKILWALIFTVLFFISDIMQFFVSAHILRWWTRKKEIQQWEETSSINGDYGKPWLLDLPAFLFFNIKAVVLSISFLIIGSEFVDRI